MKTGMIRIAFLLPVLLLLSCSKDETEKYTGTFSFTDKVTKHFENPGISDTTLYSTGTIKKIDKTTLRISYGLISKSNTPTDFPIQAIVDIKVDNAGNVTEEPGNYGNTVKISGKFDGPDKLTMKIEVGSDLYGLLSTEEISGIRSR